MFKIFKDSLYEIKNVHTMTQCAIFIALYVVLDAFSVNFMTVQFTFSFLALAVIAYIAGPTTAFFCGGACEVLGYLLAPKTGPLHLGFTFTAMLTGLVMGIILYKSELKFWKVIISRSIVAFILNLGLNTYWISTMIGKAYMLMLPGRALKTVIELPIDIILIFLVLKLITVIDKSFKKSA